MDFHLGLFASYSNFKSPPLNYRGDSRILQQARFDILVSMDLIFEYPQVIDRKPAIISPLIKYI